MNRIFDSGLERFSTGVTPDLRATIVGVVVHPRESWARSAVLALFGQAVVLGVVFQDVSVTCLLS